MDNFSIDFHTFDGDSQIKLYPLTNGAILKISQFKPDSFKNIDIELANEYLEQLRAWLDCYFKEHEEDEKKQKLISNRMAAYEVYIEGLADFKIVNSEIPKNTIEYFSHLKNYLDFSILPPQLYASLRHTVLMGFFKASEKVTHKLTLEFLMAGNSVNTILYKIESCNVHTNRYEFTDEGLKVIPLGTAGLAEDLNFKLCAKAIKDIYNEFMETDYE